MEKYHINEEAIDDEENREYCFKYRNKYEKQLLIQIICMILGNKEDLQIYSYKGGKGCKTELHTFCTKEESLQIEIAYEFYLNAWNEDVDLLLKAFIQKNRLFRPNLKTCIGENQDDVDMEKLSKMMNGIEERQLNQMIEGERT